MPVASKPLDGRLRREAAMIGGLARLYASSVEPLGLTSLGRLDGPAAAVQHGTEGATRQSRRSTADGFAVSEDANDAELRRSHQ